MPNRDELARTFADLVKSHSFEVETALASHIDWKRRLRDGVSRGYCELDSEEAGRDDSCSLGRWLHSLPVGAAADPRCEEIAELHARFHRYAAVVVQYLEAGRLDDARAAMDSDSEFAQASEELVTLLEEWREAA